jgi:hypothetical protein
MIPILAPLNYVPPNNWSGKGNLYFSDYILENRIRIKLYIKLKYKTEIWEKCHSGFFYDPVPPSIKTRVTAHN